MRLTEFHRQYQAGRRDFTGEDFKGLNLSGYVLDQVDFRGANLSGANLHSASIEGANFEWANLRDANLSFATALVMRASFRGALLLRTNFRFTKVPATDFIESVTCGADFTGANLDGCDFTNAVVVSEGWGSSELPKIRPDTRLRILGFGPHNPLSENRWRNGNAGPWREEIIGGWKHWANRKFGPGRLESHGEWMRAVDGMWIHGARTPEEANHAFDGLRELMHNTTPTPEDTRLAREALNRGYGLDEEVISALEKLKAERFTEEWLRLERGQ